jgi:hypothetical protein
MNRGAEKVSKTIRPVKSNSHLIEFIAFDLVGEQNNEGKGEGQG